MRRWMISRGSSSGKSTCGVGVGGGRIGGEGGGRGWGRGEGALGFVLLHQGHLTQKAPADYPLTLPHSSSNSTHQRVERVPGGALDRKLAADERRELAVGLHARCQRRHARHQLGVALQEGGAAGGVRGVQHCGGEQAREESGEGWMVGKAGLGFNGWAGRQRRLPSAGSWPPAAPCTPSPRHTPSSGSAPVPSTSTMRMSLRVW